MIKWCPQKLTGSLWGSRVGKGTAKVLSTVSYPGSCHAFWTGFGVEAMISRALSAKP